MNSRITGNLVQQMSACARVALVAGAIASAAAAQFDLLSWELAQHGSGESSLSDTGIAICGGWEAGSFITYTTQIPVAMRLSCDMDFNPYDGASGTSAPMMSIDGTTSVLTTDSTIKPLVVDLQSGVAFGLGLVELQSNWPGMLGFGPFTMTPVPATVAGLGTGDRLGAALAALGDLDGDGLTDLAAGMPQHAGGTGGVLLLSGADGSVLMEIDGDATGVHFGATVGRAGDVNGDGTPDLIVGAPHSSANGPDAGLAIIVSGADGSALQTFLGSAPGEEFGSSVSGAGDVNGDGVPDVVVGAPHATSGGVDSGSVRVFSGADGALLHLFVGGQAGALAGTAVALLDDVDADGLADVAVGAPKDAAGFGAVRIYSGKDGSLLHSFIGAGPTTSLLFGSTLASVGDIDSDGVLDLAVGEPLWNHGKVHVYSAALGTPLFVLEPGSSTWEMGASIANAGDVDGDGVDDIVAGAPEIALSSYYKMGRAFVFSGRDGSQLWMLSGGTNYDAYGSAVAGVGDRDGDGRAEIAIGVPGLDVAGTDAGGLIVQDFFVNWFDLGQGLAGSQGIPVFAGHGLLFAGTPMKVTLSSALANAPVALVVGFSQLGAPLKGGVLVPSVDALLLGLLTDVNGELSLGSTWPAGVPSGFEFFLQAWITDPAGPYGFASSNALKGFAL